MQKLVLGIDVGGTNIKLGIIDRLGRIVARTSLPTRTYIRDKKKLIAYIVEGSKDLLAEHKLNFNALSGIGIGLPGLIDPKKGIVRVLPNIPGWRDVHLKNIIQKKTRVPTFLENDVNLITLGEWKFGAGIGIKNLICITLGTGVGGGLILNNELYRGEGFAAGEIGHMPLNEKGPACNCGGWGCFERYVGNSCLVANINNIFKNKKLSLEDVSSLALKGDKRAIKFWKETAVHIGNALSGVVNLLNPTHIIIGGGVSNSYRFISKTIMSTIKSRAMKVQGSMVKVVRAKLGNDAGIIGARELVQAGIKA